MEPKLPHMPLWVYDLDTDRDCRKMSDATFGRYMRLLIRQWIEGCVPATPTEAMRDAMLDPGSEADIQRLLDQKFTLKDGQARRNVKCFDARNDAIKKVLTLRKNGSYGGLAKAKANGSNASGSVSGFDSFWKIYPRKVGKLDARQKFKAAVARLKSAHDDPVAHLIDRVTAFGASPKGQGDWCPHPATWLNEGRYDDDPAAWQRSGDDKAPSTRRTIGTAKAESVLQRLLAEHQGGVTRSANARRFVREKLTDEQAKEPSIVGLLERFNTPSGERRQCAN